MERLFSELRVNQMDFAKRTGFTQSYISQILSGTRTSPSRRFFDTAGREFNVNAVWLKTGKGEMYTMPDGTGENEDAEIIAKYRQLPKQEQRIIEDMVNALLARYITHTKNR